MILRTRHPAALGPVAIAAGLMMLCAPGAGASTLSPLPPADYTARAFCGPPARAQAACLALALVPQTASARAHTHPLGMARPALAPATSPVAAGYIGLRPQDLHGAYALPDTSAGAQKIAIVDAYNDPSAEADLKGYDEEFGLPACTSGNGCFTQLNQNGKASPLPFPKTSGELESARGGSAGERKTAERATGWDGEISLDIETAHAVCQNCSILLVEAETSAYATSKRPSTAPPCSARARSQTPGAGPRKARRPQPRKRARSTIQASSSPPPPAMTGISAGTPPTAPNGALPSSPPPRRTSSPSAARGCRSKRAAPGRARRSGTATAPTAAAAARSSKPSRGSRTSPAGGRSAATASAPSPTSPPTPTPIPASRCTTRAPSAAPNTNRKGHCTNSPTGAQSAARASPRR